MAVTQSVPRRELHYAAIVSCRPAHAGLAHDVVRGKAVGQLGWQKRGKAPATALFDQNGFRIGKVARDLVVGAYDFSRRSVEGFEPFELAAGRVYVMHDARRLGYISVTVDESPGVVQLAGRTRHFPQPRQPVFRLGQLGAERRKRQSQKNEGPSASHINAL